MVKDIDKKQEKAVMEENRYLELSDASVVEGDVIKRIQTTGVKGLDFEKAKELGFFKRISNLLCAAHASIMAAYRIYGGVDYLLSEFGGRKNEIAREMNMFERAFDRFVNFWTTYYAHGKAGIEVSEETETLFRHIMEWAQLPYKWELGDEQRVDNSDAEIALRMNVNDKEYTFRVTPLKEEILDNGKETWCVTKYDRKEHKQVTVETNMDKASALMVAKRMSAEDKENIYTASMVHEQVVRTTVITPFKAFRANETIGRITKQKTK